MPQERDYLRTDATAEHQLELDGCLRKNYPIIDSPLGLKAYKEGKSPYASFKLRENPVLPHIISVALDRAVDPNDAAFCTHADKHGNFVEVIEDQIIALKSGKLAIRVQNHLTPISTSVGESQAMTHRLILESARKRRSTYRPAPLQLFLEIEKQLDASRVPEDKYAIFAKVIRRAAGRYGIPFALLTCIYAGLTARPIVELFNNKDIKRKILEERTQAGVRSPRIPSDHVEEHTDLHRMVQRIRDFLVMEENGEAKPRYHADDYFEALRKLDPVYQRDFSPELSEFVQSNDTVVPKTVFAGMDELAQAVASREFIDPYRREYIDAKYRNCYSTHMITSYFDSQIDPQDLHFKELFSR